MTTKVKYKNPVLNQVICEIHFSIGQSQWDAAFPGKFLNLISDKFPNIEPGGEMPVEFKVSAQGSITPTVKPYIQKFKYFNQDKSVCYILSDQCIFGLAFLKNEDYTWEKFKQSLEEGWDKIKQCINVTSVKRIGLRYINRIPHNSTDFSISQWLNIQSDYIPKNILHSKSSFLFQSEAEMEPGVLKVTLANPEPNYILFDLDRITLEELNIDNQLFSKIEKLHSDIRQVFDTSITNTLKASMEEG